MSDPAPTRPRADRVAFLGGIVAAAGCALPFALYRENRIVSGTSHPLSAAGTLGWLLLASCAAMLLASLTGPGPRRRSLELLTSAVALGSLPWALGAAAGRLLAGALPFARVSVGGGAWLVAAGAAVVAFAGRRGPWRFPAVLLLGVTASWALAFEAGGLSRLSLVAEYGAQREAFWGHVGDHLGIVAVSLVLAVAIGVPLGVAAARSRRGRALVLGVTGVMQTVPSLALLGLLVFPLAALGLPGIGPLPATIALTLYALLPVARNTCVGLSGVEPAALDAGRGMGMGRWQLLVRVEAPLALPVVVEGVRQAAVSTIGIAAVVAFVGVGTLGTLVFLGWGQQADDLILLGALPMVAMAVAADAGLRLAGRALTSPGIRAEASP